MYNVNNSIHQQMEEEKMRDAVNGCSQSAQSIGDAGVGQGQCGGPKEVCRDGLIDRVRNQLYRAQKEAGRASRLDELNYLLSKHPEIARILDLIEDVRG